VGEVIAADLTHRETPMPIYEYQYTTATGHTRRVEKLFPMGAAPKAITVEEGDEQYDAVRVFSLTAKMATNWDSYEPSDLPPVDSPTLGHSPKTP
jgi:hypothetical protein